MHSFTVVFACWTSKSATCRSNHYRRSASGWSVIGKHARRTNSRRWEFYRCAPSTVRFCEVSGRYRCRRRRNLYLVRGPRSSRSHSYSRPAEQSRNAAQAAVEVIHTLETSSAAYEATIRDLEQQLSVLDTNTSADSIARITTDLESNRESLKKVSLSIRTKTAALGVEGRTQLRRLRGSRYLQLRKIGRAHV